MKPVSAAFQNALDAQHVTPVILAKLDFAALDVQRYCTAAVTIAWDNQTWLGTGGMVSIEPIRETGSVESVGIRITLSGVPNNLISLALQGQFQGRPATFYLALLNDQGVVIDTPILEYGGRLDTMTIVEGEETSTITVTVESEMAALMSSAARRFDDNDQQKQHPGDKFFNYVAQMKEKILPFPSKEAQRRG